MHAYPSSVNWYYSQVADWSPESHVIAYAARNVVCLLNDVEHKVVGHLVGHRDKVTGVAFNGHPQLRECALVHLASVSEDKSVCLWDVTSRSLIASHDKHTHTANCVAMSTLRPTLIASGDHGGNIVLWNYASVLESSVQDLIRGQNDDNAVSKTDEAIQVIQFSNSPLLCIAFSPHDEKQLAVGHQNGEICIVDHTSAQVLCRFASHTDQIQCLAWSPHFLAPKPKANDELNEIVEPEGVFLCSGSKDSSICIWDITHNKRARKIMIPKSTGSAYKKDKSRLWAAVAWSYGTPGELFYAGANGQLFVCKDVLDTRTDFKTNVTQFNSSQKRVVFRLLTRKADPDVLVTFSMDRSIQMFSIASAKQLFRVTTLAGSVFSISTPQWDPSVLALGVGDNTIRIWNTAKANKYHAQMIWRGIMAAVSIVEFHPSQQGLFAYGTLTGQIGLYDMTTGEKIKEVRGHKDVVYRLIWHHEEGKSENESAFKLYSLGGDNLLKCWPSMDLESPATTVTVDTTRKVKPSDVRLRGNQCAIGFTDGTVCLYTLDGGSNVLKLAKTVHDHVKLINYLAWKRPSASHNWLASASNDCTVRVYDVHALIHDSVGVDVVGSGAFTLLTGHKAAVKSLAWSPHEGQETLLLSVSSDYSGQIWDVSTRAQLVSLRGHFGRVFSCLWSPKDPNIVYTGGDDRVVCVWNITKQAHTQCFTAAEAKALAKLGKSQSKGGGRNALSGFKTAKRKAKQQAPLPAAQPTEAEEVKAASISATKTTDVSEDAKEASVKAKNNESQSKITFTLNDCVAEMERTYGDSEANEIAIVPRVLNMKELAWEGQWGVGLKQAIDQGKLNADWVAFSASLGLDAWRLVMGKYASQLLAQEKKKTEHTRLAVQYLLALGRVDDALDALLQADLCHDAYKLSMVRLLPEDPLRRQCTINYAKQCESKGIYNDAAVAYISCFEPVKAVHVLLRQLTPEVVGQLLQNPHACQVQVTELFEALMTIVTGARRSEVKIGTPISDSVYNDIVGKQLLVHMFYERYAELNAFASDVAELQAYKPRILVSLYLRDLDLGVMEDVGFWPQRGLSLFEKLSQAWFGAKLPMTEAFVDLSAQRATQGFVGELSLSSLDSSRVPLLSPHVQQLTGMYVTQCILFGLKNDSKASDYALLQALRTLYTAKQYNKLHLLCKYSIWLRESALKLQSTEIEQSLYLFAVFAMLHAMRHHQTMADLLLPLQTLTGCIDEDETVPVLMSKFVLHIIEDKHVQESWYATESKVLQRRVGPQLPEIALAGLLALQSVSLDEKSFSGIFETMKNALYHEKVAETPRIVQLRDAWERQQAKEIDSILATSLM